MLMNSTILNELIIIATFHAAFSKTDYVSINSIACRLLFYFFKPLKK